MAKEGLCGNISKDELVSRLFKTKQFGHQKEMVQHLIDLIKNQQEDNIAMPANSYFCDLVPSYREELISLYNGTFGLFEEVNVIPDVVKVAQASVLDSLMFGYDVNNDTYDLYTMNLGLVNSDLGILDDNLLEKIVQENTKGLIKAFRLDLEYCKENDSTYSYKLVNHRKKIDDYENVLLVPVLASFKFMDILEKFLTSSTTLYTKQQVNNINKVRVVSLNQEVLEHYCDTPEAVSDLQASYLPLNAYLRVPVLGAPSTTAMVTKINLFSLCSLKRVSSLKQIQKLGIQKPKNVVEDFVLENVLSTHIMNLKNNSVEEYENIFDRLPRKEQIMPNVDSSSFSPTQLSFYLHSIKSNELNDLCKLMPEAVSNSNRVCQALNGNFTKIDDLSTPSLRKYLSKGICKFIIKKKDFSTSSLICTNSKEMLKLLYGEDYFKFYEGFSARVYNTIKLYSTGTSLADALEENSILLDSNMVETLAESFMDGNVLKEDALEKAIYSLSGIKQKTSSNTNYILIRSLGAYLENGESRDYYKYLDPNKIVSAYILS